MGVEWLYWGGGGNSGGGNSGGREGGGGGGRSIKCRRTGGQSGDTPYGCMSSFFQLFDLSKFQLAFHNQVPSFKPDSFLPQEPTILKGVEAPRNSLEMEQEKPFMDADSSLSTMKEKETLNIPMGIQIKTSGGAGKSKLGSPKSRTDDLYSECSDSPRAKTPNLVARLMGLDLLPHSCSPSSSSSIPPTSYPLLKPLPRPQLVQTRPIVGKSLFDVDIAGTLSLPETPRISSGRRSDVDHHRLSLQINKENIGLADELEFWGYSSNNSRLKTSRRRPREARQEDESTGRGHHGRKIVKQERGTGFDGVCYIQAGKKVGFDVTNTVVNKREKERKEGETDFDSVCYAQSDRKFGLDVTNTIENRREKGREYIVLHKAKKAVTAGLPPPSSSPPPLSLLSVPRKVLTKQKSPWKEQEHQEEQKKNPNGKFEKIGREDRSERRDKAPRTPDVIRKKQEEPFVHSSVRNRADNSDRKCKKVSVSSDEIVDINVNVPALFLAKKDRPAPTTKLPQKQVSDSLPSKSIKQLPSCSSRAYEQERTKTLAVQGGSDDGNTSNGATTGDGGEEFQYITRILKRTGIDTSSPLSFAKWYSPSHPIHPSIFHRLEHSVATISAANQSRLRHRRSRMLIFDLVNEILADILRPSVNLKTWISPIVRDHDQTNGFRLIDAIFSKIRSFQSVDCLVLEDIDALVEDDLRELELRRSIALEEEGEGIVAEIGRQILETLVHETAMAVFSE